MVNYAVIRTGGKQYRIKEGDELTVERLDIPEGDALEFAEVLLIADKQEFIVGKPLIKGASVKAKIITQLRGKKIRVARFRRRKRYQKVQGHRQELTKVKIMRIKNGKN